MFTTQGGIEARNAKRKEDRDCSPRSCICVAVWGTDGMNSSESRALFVDATQASVVSALALLGSLTDDRSRVPP